MAEDFEAYRVLLISLLKESPALQVICEVADGLQAVEKTRELRPDLILLDIGLPKIDGIEAARRILKSVPESKILFVTQETSCDVVDEALNVGALGYIIKSRAGSELLPAIASVLEGKRFVSAGINGDSR